MNVYIVTKKEVVDYEYDGNYESAVYGDVIQATFLNKKDADEYCKDNDCENVIESEVYDSYEKPKPAVWEYI